MSQSTRHKQTDETSPAPAPGLDENGEPVAGPSGLQPPPTSPPPQPAKSVAKDTAADGSDDEPAEYIVEAIRERRKCTDGSFEYFIKWEGYPEDDNTWEPEEHLNCPEIVKAFNENFKEKEKAQKGRKKKRQQVSRVVMSFDERREKMENNVSDLEARLLKAQDVVEISSSDGDATSETSMPRRKKTRSNLRNGSSRDTDVGSDSRRATRRDANSYQGSQPMTTSPIPTTSNGTSQASQSQTSTQIKHPAKPAGDEVSPIDEDLPQVGFNRGKPVERIIGSCVDNEKTLYFFVKFKDTHQVDMVAYDELETYASTALCRWFKERFYWTIKEMTEQECNTTKSQLCGTNKTTGQTTSAPGVPLASSQG